MLALGGVDCTIRLMLAGPDTGFKQVCILTGHADWIRSLAFTHAAPDADTTTGEPHVSLQPPSGEQGSLQGLLQGLLATHTTTAA